MSTKFTKEEIDDLKKAFSICDQDGDGIISTKYLTKNHEILRAKSFRSRNYRFD